jgi:hypothetical protein
MHDIVKQFNDISNQDLFQSWQDEVRLRNRLRTCAASNVAFSEMDQATVEFLYRSLYWHKRPDFFQVLFINMNNLAVYKWLNAKPGLTREFLTNLPYLILETRPDFRQLRFLINIYRAEYQPEFIRIVNVLDISICKELFKRTANQDLRTVLRERLEKMQKQSGFDYGIKISPRTKSSYSALYGDKLHLLLRAAGALKTSRQYDSLQPDHSRRFAALLEAAGAVFEAGLIEDSLAILADAYVSYLDHNRTVNFEQETTLFKLLYRLLRRIIPVYALIYKPSAPFTTALSCYRRCFGLISPDPASLEFLKIYEIIQEGMTGPSQNIMTEIGLKAAVVRNYRPDDMFLAGLCDSNQAPVPDLARQMQLTALERMRALPHEAFISLEFLRLTEKIHFGSINDLNLLRDYMELWKWVPLPIFLNQSVIQELGFDGKTRRQAEKLLAEPSSRSHSDFKDFFARTYREVF